MRRKKKKIAPVPTNQAETTDVQEVTETSNEAPKDGLAETDPQKTEAILTPQPEELREIFVTPPAEPGQTSLFKKAAFVLLGLVVLAAAGLFAGKTWLERSVRRAHRHNAAQKIISFKQGASSSEIIARLREEGILASERPVKLWLRLLAGKQQFKAGDYAFKSPISPLEVINKLLKGEVATRSFTIPEGYNQWDIARIIGGLTGLKQPPLANPDDALALLKNTALIVDLDPQAKDLEGYLFPDTYEYTATTTREQLVETMVKRFRKVYTPELQQQARALGWNVRRVVTFASLIEKEAKVDKERELIASVYHNRLKLGERLACDPTVIYAALLAGKYRGKIYRSDLDRVSPYNTYMFPGMPPGPIASPGKRSIEATLNPAQTDYLYFVVDVTRNDGSHKFSVSSSDHERAVQLLRQQEREVQSQQTPH
jgi:UPF0755 protein